MKERPILFSGAMVRALLAGTKAQTRRVSGLEVLNADPERFDYLGVVSGPGEPHYAFHDKQSGAQTLVRCRSGQPGDRLWVRETFIQGFPVDPLTDSLQQWDADGNELPKKTWYRADNSDIGWTDDDGWQVNVPWKPSIHMPRAASRITLEITRVRVERLQAISEADALAEGIPSIDTPGAWTLPIPANPNLPAIYLGAFCKLWESINGPGSWGSNPWVWVVEFRRM